MNSWGEGSPRKIFEFARFEIECGAIWRHLKPSTHIVKLSSNVLVVAYVGACDGVCDGACDVCATVRAMVCTTVRLQ